MHISRTDKNIINLTHLKQHFLQQNSQKWETSDCFCYLTASHSFFSVSHSCYLSLSPLASAYSNYTWLLLSHSIHSSSSMLALLILFPPLLFLSSLFFSSVANLSWTFPWRRAAILHHNITWSRGDPLPHPTTSTYTYNKQQQKNSQIHTHKYKVCRFGLGRE